MKHWYSAIEVAPELEDKLKAAGLEAAPQAACEELNPSEILLIYNPPDQLIEQWRANEDTPVQISDLRHIFQQLSHLRTQGARCAASWRLNVLDSTSLLRFIQNQKPCLDLMTPYPEASPIAALITLEIFNESPEILDQYLNLELHAALFGLMPDSDYIQRLQPRILADLLLTDWWQVNSARECSHEQAESNLFRMQQIQEDFDKLLKEQTCIQSTLHKQNKLSRELLTHIAKQQLES